MINWEELEQIKKDCEEAKGSPLGMKLVEAGLVERLVEEIKILKEFMICIHQISGGEMEILPAHAWFTVERIVGWNVLADQVEIGISPIEKLRNLTKPFADEFQNRNQQPRQELESWCDPKELGIIVTDDEEKPDA